MHSEEIVMKQQEALRKLVGKRMEAADGRLPEALVEVTVAGLLFQSRMACASAALVEVMVRKGELTIAGLVVAGQQRVDSYIAESLGRIVCCGKGDMLQWLKDTQRECELHFEYFRELQDTKVAGMSKEEREKEVREALLRVLDREIERNAEPPNP